MGFNVVANRENIVHPSCKKQESLSQEEVKQALSPVKAREQFLSLYLIKLSRDQDSEDQLTSLFQHIQNS